MRPNLALAALLVALAAPRASAQFFGVTWDGDAVRIDPTTGAATVIGPTGHVQLNSMAKLLNGKLVTANVPSSEVPHLDYVDPVLGKATVFACTFLNGIWAMAVDPNSGVLYALDSNGGGAIDNLYTLDLSVSFCDSAIKHLIG